MLFSRKEVNVWPGFSDLMFMLAVTMMVVSGGVVMSVNRQAAELGKQRQTLKEMGLDPDAQEPCGLGAKVIKDLRACLNGASVSVTQRGCGLMIDSAILFGLNDARLTTGARRTVERVAPCIVDAAKAVASTQITDGAGLDSIVIEGHTDRCFYENWDAVNKKGGMGLAADRASTVYNVVFEQVTSGPAAAPPGERERILARITTRALGPFRPVDDSKCDCREKATACDGDRRVEIVVQGRVGSAKENWKSLDHLPIMPVALTRPSPGVAAPAQP